ncbi:MAG: nucleotidyl transferase AbiEii/AbiGii toxin family protein [bacterium]|nr:nucleotidyl transferase AbiEii/AbiGii toxin family protein [bacterium]
MKKQNLLTDSQKLFLGLLAANKSLSSRFYLSGGTALINYYIPYRYSEDLDFFSEKEVDTGEITVFIRSVKNKLGYATFDFNTAYNRNLFFLNFNNNSILKTEFTYFPFPPIEKPKKREGVMVDSILDIAVNKLFTIYQKPRSRDFMDLYMIHKKCGFLLEDLVKKARIKFDWHIDNLKLGSQFLLSQKLKDYPKLDRSLPEYIWQSYFRKEAKKLGRGIIG